MKFLVFLLLAFSSALISLAEVRDSFEQAALSATAAKSFAATLKNVNKGDEPTLVAYKGAALTLVAKFSKQKEEKKLNFRSGVGLIESAVERDPNNIEIRFIRLTIQENTPPFLRYKRNVEEDKALLIKHFGALKSSGLKKNIRTYVATSKVFSVAEKQVFKN